MATSSPLCQLNGGCMGCCGRHFNDSKIAEAIEFNNKEFQQFNSKSQGDMIKFRDRYDPDDLNFGVCRNLISENNSFLCPLHPARNKGAELREGHCDLNHLCSTAKSFAQWHDKKQEEFMVFIKRKKLAQAISFQRIKRKRKISLSIF
ncbi:hypothetical protein HYX12_03465 [Candidatus Woesearchaeota archaeon]|nr:hypothetical protein [Candidatus Woesearchaeota archaeon]